MALPNLKNSLNSGVPKEGAEKGGGNHTNSPHQLQHDHLKYDLGKQVPRQNKIQPDEAENPQPLPWREFTCAQLQAGSEHRNSLPNHHDTNVDKLTR